MEMMRGRPDQHVGVVGLGTGSLAAYAGANRRFSFFEIDPQMVEIAYAFFTYLRRCGSNCTVTIADGRLAIAQAPDGEFDLLIIDGFNSDSIPPHLISLEAVKTYISKLKPHGAVLFHVTNRYLDIETLVSTVLKAVGLPALGGRDFDDSIPEKSGSSYVISARRLEELGSILSNAQWNHLAEHPTLKPWTDDYSNVLSLFQRH